MIKIGEVEIKPTVFPDGTSQVWRLPDSVLDTIYKENSCVIDWEFEKESELVHVAQLKTLLDHSAQHVYLNVPYLPYGRQDKRVDNRQTFALRSFALLINSLHFEQVITLDAHNNSRAHMIERLEDRSPKRFIESAFEESGADVLLFPDFGAQGRYEALNIGPCVVANKTRNQETGNIESVWIEGNVKRKKVLIVDDICDGGMTFKMVSDAARAHKSGPVHLYVTHGIFSKGIQTLRDSGIKRIFTHKGEIN